MASSVSFAAPPRFDGLQRDIDTKMMEMRSELERLRILGKKVVSFGDGSAVMEGQAVVRGMVAADAHDVRFSEKEALDTHATTFEAAGSISGANASKNDMSRWINGAMRFINTKTQQRIWAAPLVNAELGKAGMCAPTGRNHWNFYGQSIAPKGHFVAAKAGHLAMLNDGLMPLALMCPRGDESEDLMRWREKGGERVKTYDDDGGVSESVGQKRTVGGGDDGRLDGADLVVGAGNFRLELDDGDGDGEFEFGVRGAEEDLAAAGAGGNDENGKDEEKDRDERKKEDGGGISPGDGGNSYLLRVHYSRTPRYA